METSTGEYYRFFFWFVSISARAYRTLDRQLYMATTVASSPDNVTAGNRLSVCDSGVDALPAHFSVAGLYCRGLEQATVRRALELQIEEVYNVE